MSGESLDRYSRQVRFPQLGEEGQRALLGSRVALCGCGALGTVLANHLARAGVGSIRVIDRDFIETHNLQRQILFDEQDVADNLPKAEAAARKMRAINSTITVEPVVTDLDHTNILDLVGDADLILDGTDNFETRYLINDAAVKLGKPWIYGGVIGSEGQTMTIIPGKTPCLRCLIETAPPPGMTPTCETAGVLGPAVAVIASFEAVEAIKLLAGRLEALNDAPDHGQRLGLDVPPAQGGQPAGQGRLPVLPAAEIRVARRFDGVAHDHAVRPQRRPGGRTPARAARLPRDGAATGRRWARCGTTRSCSGSPPKDTSSPCSPTGGRSSRAPMTSPGRGRFMRSSWGVRPNWSAKMRSADYGLRIPDIMMIRGNERGGPLVKYQRFEDLPVWNDAIELAVRLLRISQAGRLNGIGDLKSQLERAAISISNNIAEGFERGTNQELITFLYFAKGSAGEVQFDAESARPADASGKSCRRRSTIFGSHREHLQTARGMDRGAQGFQVQGPSVAE